MRKTALLFSAAAIMLLTACGPGKKLRSAMSDIKRLDSINNGLMNQVSGLQKNVEDLTQKNGALTQQNNELNNRLGTANTNMASQQQKMEALQKSLQQQRNAMENLRTKIAGALNNFKSDEIQVTYKNGLVYISMQDKLLFKTGSANLGTRGKEALSTVANVLNQDTTIKIMVVGHTDSIPMHGAFRDNWSLSTERANTIVRILNESYHVDPARLTAAGRSKYSPVADNNTLEGRALNRRTEIILTPDLSQVWDLVNSSSTAGR
jgi:chemotaxis protein MotB